MMRFLFERLETSPSQEKVIVDAVEALRERGRKLRGELGTSRETLAATVRAGTFDEGPLQEAFNRHDVHFKEMRELFLTELAKVHGVLEEGQRRELADLLGQGFRRPGFF